MKFWVAITERKGKGRVKVIYQRGNNATNKNTQKKIESIIMQIRGESEKEGDNGYQSL